VGGGIPFAAAGKLMNDLGGGGFSEKKKKFVEKKQKEWGRCVNRERRKTWVWTLPPEKGRIKEVKSCKNEKKKKVGKGGRKMQMGQAHWRSAGARVGGKGGMEAKKSSNGGSRKEDLSTVRGGTMKLYASSGRQKPNA